MPALLGALGTIFMAVIISVCSAVVQPFQCDTHPNGRSTMRAYREVICWNSKDHKHMMIAGVVASLVPLAFFSMCSWATFSLPKRLQRGDTVYLTTFSFLFFRFRPGAHYLLFSLLRSFTLAVVPVLEGPASELLTSCAVVTACIIFSGAVSPRAVRQANQLDLAIHTGLLFILFLAALHTHRIGEVEVGNLLVAVFCATMCAFLGAAAWLVHLCALRLKKPFQFFLCHHKVGAGAFCRLLKTRLKMRGVARDVFLDSDNLQDLSLPFAIVSEKKETLVVLCSREILHRPWCVGEMTTARLHHIDTILVMFPDFQMPSRAFIEGYDGVEGAQSLAPYGIGLEMVQHTLWWLGTRPRIVLPCAMSLAGVDAVVGKLISRRGGRDEMATVACMESTTTIPDTEESGVAEGGTRWRQPQRVSHQVVEPYRWLTPATVSVVSIVDHSNQESVCTALLVKELLKTFFPLSGLGHVLAPEENVPVDATTVLVMSSNGCFQKPRFIRQLFQVEAPGICAFPIIVDDTFQIPSDALFRELRALSSSILSDPLRDPADLIAIIQCLFQEIGTHVRPQDSLAALEVVDTLCVCVGRVRVSVKFLRRENYVIFSNDTLTCGQKAKCWWHFQAGDVCEQALWVTSVEMTLRDRLVAGLTRDSLCAGFPCFPF